MKTGEEKVVESSYKELPTTPKLFFSLLIINGRKNYFSLLVTIRHFSALLTAKLKGLNLSANRFVYHSKEHMSTLKNYAFYQGFSFVKVIYEITHEHLSNSMFGHKIGIVQFAETEKGHS